MAAAVVRHAGARFVVITDVNPYRLELARKFGVTRALDVRTDASPMSRRNSACSRVRYRLEMSGNPTAFVKCWATCATAPESPCWHPAGGNLDRLEHRHLQPATH